MRHIREGRRFYRGYHATRLDNCSISQGKVFAPVLKYGVFIWQAGVKRRAVLEQKAARAFLKICSAAMVLSRMIYESASSALPQTRKSMLLYLTREDSCVRPLHGENEGVFKRPPLPRNDGGIAFNLRE